VGSGLLATMLGGVKIVIEYVLVEQALLAPVAFTVKLAFVATVGVPLITPALLKLSPVGNSPAVIVHV
jgi:hypothetical protein